MTLGCCIICKKISDLDSFIILKTRNNHFICVCEGSCYNKFFGVNYE